MASLAEVTVTTLQFCQYLCLYRSPLQGDGRGSEERAVVTQLESFSRGGFDQYAFFIQGQNDTDHLCVKKRTMKC